jgi:murein DD-endopeptidase MepM/ murein hydrolase activator NlpD
MHKHVATRRDMQPRGTAPIRGVGIGDVNRFIKPAVAVSAVKDVDAFRRFVVALLCLRANRLPAQRYHIGFQCLSVPEQSQSTFGFYNDGPVRFGVWSQGLPEPGTDGKPAQRHDEQLGTHPRDYRSSEISRQCYAGLIVTRNGFFRGLVLAVFVISILPIISFGEAAPASRIPQSKLAKAWSVAWQPPRLVNGSPVVFRISAPGSLVSLEGIWLEHKVFFDLDANSKQWYGIGGVSLETKRGDYLLKLSGVTEQGKPLSFDRKIPVRTAKYRSVAAHVASQFTEPSPEQLQQINQDKEVKQKVFGRLGLEQEWSGTFEAPVKAPISDVFGTRRTFNGKVQSLHQGLDYAVPTGTPIAALNHGTVLLARPLFFEGNCVVLDHGQGLLTLYLHLSKIRVKEGDVVERGQQIALSGGTGRATGPHLHLAVRWQGVYVDPATLLTLKLP